MADAILLERNYPGAAPVSADRKSDPDLRAPQRPPALFVFPFFRHRSRHLVRSNHRVVPAVPLCALPFYAFATLADGSAWNAPGSGRLFSAGLAIVLDYG